MDIGILLTEIPFSFVAETHWPATQFKCMLTNNDTQARFHWRDHESCRLISALLLSGAVDVFSVIVCLLHTRVNSLKHNDYT